MAWSGLEALPKGREWSEGHSKGPGVVGRSSRRAGSGQESLPYSLEWSRDPPGGPRVVGNGLESFLVDLEWSE